MRPHPAFHLLLLVAGVVLGITIHAAIATPDAAIQEKSIDAAWNDGHGKGMEAAFALCNQQHEKKHDCKDSNQENYRAGYTTGYDFGYEAGCRDSVPPKQGSKPAPLPPPAIPKTKPAASIYYYDVQVRRKPRTTLIRYKVSPLQSAKPLPIK